MSHTKGPWQREGLYIVGERYVCEACDWSITGAGGQYEAENSKLREEQSDNMTLIAAAPDLVKALEELAQYAELVVQDISDLDCAWYYQLKAKLELAQQVLTKAKGTTS